MFYFSKLDWTPISAELLKIFDTATDTDIKKLLKGLDAIVEIVSKKIGNGLQDSRKFARILLHKFEALPTVGNKSLTLNPNQENIQFLVTFLPIASIVRLDVSAALCSRIQHSDSNFGDVGQE